MHNYVKRAINLSEFSVFILYAFILYVKSKKGYNNITKRSYSILTYYVASPTDESARM